MNKVIIIFGLFLILIAGVAYYQFSKSQSFQANGSVTIKEHKFMVDPVRTPEAQQIGLTKYNALNDDQAMLFIFEKPGSYGFWMKNMKFPIDIIFINGDTIVSFVEDAKPVSANETNPSIYTPESPADKVLEIKSGLIKKYSIQKGDKATIAL